MPTFCWVPPKLLEHSLELLALDLPCAIRVECLEDALQCGNFLGIHAILQPVPNTPQPKHPR